MNQFSASEPSRSIYEVIIIGAGFAGIGAAIQLKKIHSHFIVLEKSSEIGGVWRDNNYPGCGCDVPSPLYSYSFAPNPYWSNLFAKQAEIKQYTLDTCHQFGIHEHIHLEESLTQTRWLSDQQVWEVTSSKTVHLAKFVIMATGPMHVPVIPSVEGLDSFKGQYFHSSQWNYDCSLKGQRVAVIGSGASAIQFVPSIQPEVGELTLFQRTAPWVLPKLDIKFSKSWQSRFVKFPILLSLLRKLIYVQFEFLNSSLNYPFFLKKLQQAGIKNIYRGIKNPELAKSLIPNFSLGCKRILLSNHWYRALNQNNVKVLSGIEKIDGNQLTASNGQSSEVDIIIFGTGFEVSSMPIAKSIIGHSGQTLEQQWGGSPKAYLGTMVDECPNLFIIFGPNLYTYTSAFVIFEAQLRFIISAINTARNKNLNTIAVNPKYLDQFNQKLQTALKNTIWNSGCQSYFINPEGINSTIWPWTSIYMRFRLRRFNPKEFITT
jgi:cation diffusion facilitator CzcD-associated flavoprotein CzcO